MFEALISLLIGLAVIAVVGHLLWIAAAWVFRSLAGLFSDGVADHRSRCTICTAMKPTKEAVCPGCGHAPALSPKVMLRRDLDATGRQLNRFLEQNVLTAEEHQRLKAVLESERAKLAPKQSSGPAVAKVIRGQDADATPTESTSKTEPSPADQPDPTSEPTSKEPRSAKPKPRAAKVVRPAPAEKSIPRRALSDVFHAFMEEKNIRWMELVCGMLIVGSSVGLVVSFWSTLNQRLPVFPAMLFLLITGALHAAGNYSLKHWKLETTSRGLFLISSLLAPLNILALIALYQHRAIDAPFLAVVGIALPLLTWWTYRAGGLLVPGWQWPWTIGIAGGSAAQLALMRGVGGSSPPWAQLTLALLPLACFLIATLWPLATLDRSEENLLRRAQSLFRLLGLSAFALLVAEGLLIARVGDVRIALQNLSPLVSLFALPALGIGLALHHGLVQRSASGPRLVGTSLAILGALIQLIALGLAWPDPHLIAAVGVVTAAALSVIAIKGRFAVLHLPAILAAALAWLVIVLERLGRLPAGVTGRELVDALLTVESSAILTLFTVIVGGVTVFWFQRNRASDAFWYAVGCGVLGSANVLIAIHGCMVGGPATNWATIVFGLHAVALLAVNQRLKHRACGWVGSILLLLTTLHALTDNTAIMAMIESTGNSLAWPITTALLIHSTLAIVIATVILWRSPGANDVANGKRTLWAAQIVPLTTTAMVSSVIALPRMLAAIGDHIGHASILAFWISSIWLAVALIRNRPGWFACFQFLSMFGVVAATAWVKFGASWTSISTGLLLDPYHLQLQGVVAALLAFGWSMVRRSMPTPSRFGQLLTSAAPVDRMALGGVVVGLIGFPLAACMPGILAELGLLTASYFDNTSVHPLFTVHAVVVLFLFLAGLWMNRRNHASARYLFGLTIASSVAVIAWDIPLASLWADAGISRDRVFETGSWAVLGVTLAALLESLFERFRSRAVLGLVLAGASAPLLIAGTFESFGTFESSLATATASVMRWAFALYGLAIAGCLWWRHWLFTPSRMFWSPGFADRSPDVPDRVRLTSTVLIGCPVFLLSIVSFVYSYSAGVYGGPWDPGYDGVFASIGLAHSIAWPLVMVAVVFAGHALRDRLPGYALAASWTTNLAASLAFVIPFREPWTYPYRWLWFGGVRLTVEQTIELAQINALVFGVCGLAWLAMRRWIESAPIAVSPGDADRVQGTPRSLLVCQIVLACVVNASLIGAAAVAIILRPGDLPEFVAHVGNGLGVLSALVAFTTAVWYIRPNITEIGVNAIGGLGLLAGAFVAAQVSVLNLPTNWLSYHVLATSATALCVIAAAAGWLIPRANNSQPPNGWSASLWRDRNLLTSWTITLGVGSVLLAWRGGWLDPGRPWWSMGWTIAIAIVAISHGLRTRSIPASYASAALIVLATAFHWIGLPGDQPMQSWLHLGEALIIAGVGAGLLWLGIEIWWQRRREQSFDLSSTWPPVHHAAAMFGLCGAALLTPMIIGRSLASVAVEPANMAGFVIGDAAGWSMLGIVGGLWFLLLWDRSSRHIPAGLYALGLVAVAIGIDVFDPTPRLLALWLAQAVAAYVLVTAFAWYAGSDIGATIRRLGGHASDREREEVGDWLPIANLVLGACVLVIQLVMVLTLVEPAMRIAAAMSTVLLVPAAVAMAENGLGRPWRSHASLLLAASLSLLGWAFLPVEPPGHFWLVRSIRLMVVLAGLSFVYGLPLMRWLERKTSAAASAWLESVRWSLVVVAGSAVVAIGWTLVQEWLWFVPVQGAPTNRLQVAAVAVTMIGLVIALLSLALSPGRDRSVLSDRGRRLYVFGAELVLTLLFVHFYLTMPWLFGGFLKPYWPFIVMAIAFAGVGFGELAQRARIEVLAQPLGQTGAFLPLLPVLGFWTVPSVTGYSPVLFVAGLLYAVLSVARKSFGFGVLAALAGNGGLWVLLSQGNNPFHEHPQLWLIPPAISVLAAAYLGRDRIEESQLVTIRYLCILTIYVSSTAEMFIGGIGNSLWLPMALATLSILGVLAGIALRVRAFLYLGSSFLFLSITSMVWHASANIGHVWPWWAFGVLSGIVLLVLFGAFEKKRNEVLAMVEQLKSWER